MNQPSRNAFRAGLRVLLIVVLTALVLLLSGGASVLPTGLLWAALIMCWPGLMMWVIIIFFIAGTSAPPLDDLSPVTAGRRWLGYAAFVILLLTLAPLPHALWPTAGGIHCPYA